MSQPSPCPSSVRIARSLLVPCLLAAVSVAVAVDRVAAQPAATAEAAAEGLVVPPLPEGTPEEMLAFVAGLMPPKAQPKSREEALQYLRDVAGVAVQAADKVLAVTKPGDGTNTQASMLKLESLARLAQFGDEQAGADMEAFAKSLATSPVPELAMEAKRLEIVSAAQQMFSEEKYDSAAGLVTQVAEMLKAAPADAKTAMLAMQLCGALEQIPGGETVAAQAMTTLGPILESSPDARIKELGAGFAAKLRLLSLPGNPMEISGSLLDGGAFDQKSLAGKVVLVDFWATWCGPCVAEIPNVVAQYEKYHDKGFEVIGISLDEEKDKVDAFVAEHKIPWPILYAGKGWQDPVAQFYGISGIPQMILIGRDGKVITVNARGEKLAERLAELFKDGG